MGVSRRHFLATIAAAPTLAWATPRLPWDDDFGQRLAALEAAHGGRLGVSALDTGSGDTLAFRAHERFAMCSTFKALLAAQVLAAVEAGATTLERRVHWTAEEMVSWSPVVEKADADAGLTLAALCEAAVTTSDNTAANLLLREHGGPAGLTAWLRSIGDATTRLDRNEPALNEAAPGDPRDTTTPAATTATWRTLLLGDALAPASRARLTDWLVRNTSGDRRLRAGLPGWTVGDKTGTSNTQVSNDVAIAWPPGGGAPVIVAAYYAESPADPATRDRVLAETGRIVAAWSAAGG